MPLRRAFTMPLTLCLLASLLLSIPAAGQDQGDELRRAAAAGDAARVKALLDAGADVNAANAYGGTALAFAADKGHAEVVKLLLARGAKVDVKDTFYNSTPISWAVFNGHPEVVRTLLAAGSDPAPVLSTAVMVGQPAVVKVVLERGGLAPEALSEALVAAAKSEEPEGKEIVALLEAAGAKPPPPPPQIDPAVLQGYAGTYRAPEGFTLAVTAKDGKLVASGEGAGTFTFVPVDATNFRAEEFPALKGIFDPAKGTLTIEQPGRTFVLERAAAGAEAPKKGDTP